MIAVLRAECGAHEDAAEPRPHAGCGAIQPEVGARRKAPIPSECVTLAPSVLLAAGRCDQAMLAVVDLDGARDCQRRVCSYVGDRRKSLPARAQKGKRRLARFPAKIPPDRTRFGVDLA